MDKSWEIAICVAAAFLFACITLWVTRQRFTGATRILVNSLAGGIIIAGLSAFNIVVLPLNLFNMLCVGLLGAPGAAVVVAAALLL